MRQRFIVGISGASGTILAKELLHSLSFVKDFEVHLIISTSARQVIQYEGGTTLEELESFANTVYSADDFAAPPASGSWLHRGMVVCPCSMSSLAAIATGCGTNLLHRAADVCLKERRPLVLVTRETPLSAVHITNMQAATLAGATIMPPCPAFYAGLYTLEDAARHFAARVLDQFGIAGPPIARWQGKNMRATT